VDEGRKVIFLGSAAMLNSFEHYGAVQCQHADDEIDTVLEREQFDILHFHEPWVPVLSRQILSRSSTANVATFHAMLPDTRVLRRSAKYSHVYQAMLRHIDAFAAVSDVRRNTCWVWPMSGQDYSERGGFEALSAA